jgi:hypothetical protein
MRASYYLLTVLLLLCALAAFMASGNIATAIDKPPIAPSAAEHNDAAGLSPDASTMPAYLSWFIKTYDDCILDYMQNSSNPTATDALSMACRHKYKEQHGSAFDDCILDNIKAVNDDTAVGIIVRSCRNKFGQPYP